MNKVYNIILAALAGLCFSVSVPFLLTATDTGSKSMGDCDPKVEECDPIKGPLLKPATLSTVPTSRSFFSASGFQLGGFLGQTAFANDQVNFSIRAYTRQGFSRHLFGEAAISFGIISGLNYKTRLIPIDYRFNYQLAGFGVDNIEFLNFSGAPYIYLGAGLLYHTPISVPSPDDPLTIEMGGTLPSSNYWSFNRGITPVVPAGVGIDFRVDPSTVLSFQFGYNQSLNAMALSGDGFRSGYWGFTFGFNVRTKNEKLIRPMSPASANRTPTAMAPPFAIASPSPVMKQLDDIDGRNVRFDVLSAVVKPEYTSIIENTARTMNLNSDLFLDVSGHADRTGDDPVNDMISFSRALSVYFELIDLGVEPERLSYNAFSNENPITSEERRESYYLDRRVEFRTSRTRSGEITKPQPSDMYVPAHLENFEYNSPLFPSNELVFEHNSLELDSFSEMNILLTSYLMHSRPEMKLMIVSDVEFGAGKELREALAFARPNVIRAKLTELGIDPSRVLAVNKKSSAEIPEEYRTRDVDGVQRNLLLPVEKF